MSTSSRLHRRRIGEILVNEGVVTHDQLEDALSIQRKTGEMLGAILVDLNYAAESDISRVLCLQYQLPFLTLVNYEFDKKLVELFPAEFLVKNKLIPFDQIGEMLLILITEIPAEEVLTEIPRLTKLNAALYLGYSSEVDRYLVELLGKEATARITTRVPVSPPAPSDEVEDRYYDDEDDDEDTADSVPEELVIQTIKDDGEVLAAADGSLVFEGSSKNFMEELDSTWDTIFPGAESEDE